MCWFWCIDPVPENQIHIHDTHVRRVLNHQWTWFTFIWSYPGSTEGQQPSSENIVWPLLVPFVPVLVLNLGEISFRIPSSVPAAFWSLNNSWRQRNLTYCAKWNYVRERNSLRLWMDFLWNRSICVQRGSQCYWGDILWGEQESEWSVSQSHTLPAMRVACWL